MRILCTLNCKIIFVTSNVGAQSLNINTLKEVPKTDGLTESMTIVANNITSRRSVIIYVCVVFYSSYRYIILSARISVLYTEL